MCSDLVAKNTVTTRWYNDPIPDEAGLPSGRTQPVWSVAPESVIVAPAPGIVLDIGVETLIRGWAWSDAGIARVDVSLDGGRGWSKADLAPRVERAWQRFSLVWRPERSGPYRLQSRARNADGTTQPVALARNAIHSVDVSVA